MKIQRTQQFWDGQKIFVLGTITSHLFRQYMDFYSGFEGTLEQQAHCAIKNLIKKQYSELYQWLCSQNCQTTNWIDDKIFSLPYKFSAQDDLFDWGIGFKSDDPVETLFILRWS